MAKRITREIAEAVRAEYANTMRSLGEIARRHGVSLRTLDRLTVDLPPARARECARELAAARAELARLREENRDLRAAIECAAIECAGVA